MNTLATSDTSTCFEFQKTIKSSMCFVLRKTVGGDGEIRPIAHSLNGLSLGLLTKLCYRTQIVDTLCDLEQFTRKQMNLAGFEDCCKPNFRFESRQSIKNSRRNPRNADSECLAGYSSQALAARWQAPCSASSY